MQRPSENEYNSYYQRYIDRVPAGDFLTLFRDTTESTIQYFKALPAEKHNYQYAPGKWTLKQMLMHIIDTERIMCYRALVAARGDSTTPLPSFDEDAYARIADGSNREMDDLLEEFAAVRYATEKLFVHMTDAESSFRGNAAGHPFTPRALGYIMVGHILHHINVIEERYL